MKKKKVYDIQFVGLKLGKHHFDYPINKAFFELFEYNDFNDLNVNTQLILEKKTNMLALSFITEGTVNINCDLTNEPYDEYIKGTYDLVVKFADEYNDENDEILYIPYGEYKINVAQYIYETIVLAIPYKRVHPGVKDGSLKSELLEKLEELTPKEESNKEEKEAEEVIDPRWNKLKELLKNDK